MVCPLKCNYALIASIKGKVLLKVLTCNIAFVYFAGFPPWKDLISQFNLIIFGITP